MQSIVMGRQVSNGAVAQEMLPPLRQSRHQSRNHRQNSHCQARVRDRRFTVTEPIVTIESETLLHKRKRTLDDV